MLKQLGWLSSYESVEAISNTGNMVWDTILNRRSTRSFTNKRILNYDLNDLLTAGIYAPSGSNSQNQRFLLLTDKEQIKKICLNKDRKAKWLNDSWMSKANAIILVFADTALITDRDHNLWEFLSIQNASASIENILLLATHKGIGSCWISFVDQMNYTVYAKQPWRELLSDYEIPQSYLPYGMVLLGHPKEMDDDGYPLGDLRHGPNKNKVVRKPLEHYLIKKKDEIYTKE